MQGTFGMQCSMQRTVGHVSSLPHIKNGLRAVSSKASVGFALVCFAGTCVRRGWPQGPLAARALQRPL